MNIFYLDSDLKQCVESYYDSHVRKMLIETCQILSNTYYYTGQEKLAPYQLAYWNHPQSKWVRTSLSNWIWLYNLGLCIYDEYRYRFDKMTHKSGEIIRQMVLPNLIDIGLTTLPCSMPNVYKISNNPIINYRMYYIYGKSYLAKYTKRVEPEWLRSFNPLLGLDISDTAFHTITF